MQPLRPSVLLAGLCGAVYGPALARALFETQPQSAAFFNTWPGALTAAAVCALAVAGLIHISRTAAFAALPLATIDRMSLQNKLADIGKLDGATARASND